MEAAYHFVLGCGRSSGDRTPRPIVAAVLPGSCQTLAHRRGVGGGKRGPNQHAACRIEESSLTLSRRTIYCCYRRPTWRCPIRLPQDDSRAFGVTGYGNVVIQSGVIQLSNVPLYNTHDPIHHVSSDPVATAPGIQPSERG